MVCMEQTEKNLYVQTVLPREKGELFTRESKRHCRQHVWPSSGGPKMRFVKAQPRCFWPSSGLFSSADQFLMLPNWQHTLLASNPAPPGCLSYWVARKGPGAQYKETGADWSREGNSPIPRVFPNRYRNFRLSRNKNCHSITVQIKTRAALRFPWDELPVDVVGLEFSLPKNRVAHTFRCFLGNR